MRSKILSRRLKLIFFSAYMICRVKTVLRSHNYHSTATYEQVVVYQASKSPVCSLKTITQILLTVLLVIEKQQLPMRRNFFFISVKHYKKCSATLELVMKCTTHLSIKFSQTVKF
jgi:hypothetical protein